MTSVVDLWNRALSAAGSEEGVADTLENSREAVLCRKWFSFVCDMVQGAAPWPSITRYARLAKIADMAEGADWGPGDPAPSFPAAFAVPANLLRPYHLQSYRRFRYLQGRISTDDPSPILFYLAREPDISKWDHDLLVATTHMLAAYLAKPLSGRSQNLEENLQIAMLRTEAAQSMAANANDLREETLPDWLQVRGYGNSPVEKFFYPLGQLNVEAVR